MRRAFLDTSCLVAIALSESGAAAVQRKFATHQELMASPLLEAELRAALRRERVETSKATEALIASLRWVIPERALTEEIEAVLAAGYVKGADCWHLATALYLSPDPSELTFLTLDARQGEVAKALGFRV